MSQVSPDAAKADPSVGLGSTPASPVIGNDQSITGQGESRHPPSQSQSQRPTPLINRIPGVGGRGTFDDQSEGENPCRFFCDVTTAAMFFIFINLWFSFANFCVILNFKSIGSTNVDNFGGYMFVFAYPVTYLIDPDYLKLCFLGPIVVSNSYGIIMFPIWLADLITTIAFLLAVFYRTGVSNKILLSRIFMWYNLYYPGYILHISTFITVMVSNPDCRKGSPLWLMRISILITWEVFSTWVARTYKNGLLRAGPLAVETPDGDTSTVATGGKSEKVWHGHSHA